MCQYLAQEEERLYKEDLEAESDDSDASGEDDDDDDEEEEEEEEDSVRYPCFRSRLS